MLERIRTSVKGFVEEYEVPLIHKHNLKCTERRRNFFLGLYNQPGDVERLQKQFEGSELVNIDSIEGGIWGKDSRYLNMTFLDIPNLGFVPNELEREFIYGMKHNGALWVDVIFSDDGLEHISPQVRRVRDIAHMERPGYISVALNGISDGPMVNDLAALNDATIYLERKREKGKFDAHKWTLKIGSVTDRMAESN